MISRAFYFCFLNFLVLSSGKSTSKEKEWDGKWFPNNPNDQQNISTEKPASSSPESSEKWTGNWFPNNPQTTHDQYKSYEKDRIMGIPNSECDDGETNLQTDFDPTKNTLVYTCLEETLKSNCTLDPLQTIYAVPKFYTPVHKCMNSTIEYEEKIPTLGSHRPLWPVYGEYVYVPVQRWLHSLEHGAIVFLYHPCANQNEVEKFRALVKNCLYRHIITPYPKLSPERPYALLGWATSLEMSCFGKEDALDFIKKYAKSGPEKTSKDGQYKQLLKTKAEIVSDKDDSQICPNDVKM